MLRGLHLITLSLYIFARTSQGFFTPNNTYSSPLSHRSLFTEKESASSTTDNTPSEEIMSSSPSSWRSLLHVSMAKTRKIRGSNYVQLSTVEDGEPRCRTVVFRGFLKLPSDHELANEASTGNSSTESCIMKMCTDLRSKKVTQNQKQPVAELVWWFPKTSEQYRVRGSLHLIGDDTTDRTLEIARKELWGNLSDPAREGFLSPIEPGASYNPSMDAPVQVPPGGRGEDGKPVPPPKNFLLMLLNPTNVDYLCLSGDQYRQIDERNKDEGAWTFERVNP